MEQSGQNDQDKNTSESPAGPTAGERLRAAREARDLSIKDIASHTRQSVDLLASIEAMETNHISPTILRLQVATYAQYLNLPSSEIASAFCKTRSAPDSTAMPLERLRNSRKDKQRSVWPVVAAAAVLIAGGIGFWAFQSSATEQVSSAPVATKLARVPLPSRTDTNLAAAATAPEISIRAVKTAWIEVRGSDGTIFRSRNMSKGEVYYPRMNATWTVTVRDAGAFEWWLGSHLVGPLGDTGVPVYSVSVDAAKTRGEEQLSTALADIERADRAPR